MEAHTDQGYTKQNRSSGVRQNHHRGCVFSLNFCSHSTNLLLKNSEQRRAKQSHDKQTHSVDSTRLTD